MHELLLRPSLAETVEDNGHCRSLARAPPLLPSQNGRCRPAHGIVVARIEKLQDKLSVRYGVVEKAIAQFWIDGIQFRPASPARVKGVVASVMLLKAGYRCS